MPKFVFDLDGTITSVETLPLIARHFSVEKDIERLTRQTLSGSIPFMESFIQRVHLLGQLPVNEISDLLQSVSLHENILSFIARHRDDCVIATGNLSQWVKKLLERVNCEAYCSDAVIKDNRVAKLTHILKKESVVNELKAKGDFVVFIGDGHNDQEAMRCADVAIAAGLTHFPARGLITVADYIVFEENCLCRLLEQLY